MMESSVRWTIILLAFIFHSVSCQYFPYPACEASTMEVDFESKPGYCTWKGQCVENKATGGMFNCYYNGPAVNVSKDADLIKMLNETCPWYVKGPGGRDTEVCCDITQVQQLQNQTGIARSLFARCPACIENFMKHFCFTTCDPNMSLYIQPYNRDTKESTVMNCTDDKGKEIVFVESVNVGLDTQFAHKLFNSCENVEYPQQSGKVIDLMCGSVDKCSANAWLTFLGDPGLDYNQAPFLMQYTFLNKTDNATGLQPFSTNIANCYDEGSLQCSCSDCPSTKVCPPPLTEEPPKKLFKYIMFGVSGASLLSAMILFTVTLVSACLLLSDESYDALSGEDDERNSSSSSHVSINDSDTADNNGASSSIHFCSICDFCYGKGLYPLVQIGTWMEFVIKALFYRWGLVASRGWFIVLPVSLLVFGGLAVGILKFTVVTDPVKLWSAPNSQARLEKEYFDNHFGPFYRTEQIIIRPRPGIVGDFTMTMPGELHETEFGPVFNWAILHEVYQLQNDLMNIKVRRDDDDGGGEITLRDICFKPLYPDNDDCTIESVINYFQNNYTRLSYKHGDGFIITVNATSHINYCMRNPTATQGHYATDPKWKFGCLGAYGGPVDPNTIFGGFPSSNGNNQYNLATALIVTFIVNNHVDEKKNKDAELWEAEFIKHLKNFEGQNITVSFMSERSIVDEINRESKTDEVTILISYIVMFLYIAIFLGKLRAISTVFVDLKIILGFFGVLIVLLSVAGSVGFLSLVGIEGSLIILEVVPFLVLAVGVDNLFILVHSYERQSAAHGNLPVHQLVARALGEVAPSLILTASSESAAFLLGAISNMPAVRSFSLYAGVAVFFNFLLQISAFVSFMYLDALRSNVNAIDVLWFVKLDKIYIPTRRRPGILFYLMQEFYSKLILHKIVRPFILLIFGMAFSAALFSLPWLKAGLDQNLALPKDSYLQPYFKNMYKYLHIGAPVYFVIKGGLNFTDLQDQNKICSASFCDKYSVGTQISFASTYPNITHLAEPGSIWLDSYYEWLDPSSTCCGHDINDITKICDNPQDPSSVKKGVNVTCVHCLKNGAKRPTSEEFLQFLQPFFTANPNTKCAAAGHAAYNTAVVIDYTSKNKDVLASYIMSFHTISSKSDQFISSLKEARKISANLSATVGVEVFPYSVFYVYYDQYLHTYRDMLMNIGLSLGAVFVVSTAMLGLNVWGSCMVMITVIMIVIDLIGVMVLLDINANAVSLVNLVMTVGIAVEFSAHIVRWFISCKGTSRISRARSALGHMGSSVVSGITITKFLGVFILAFAKSQLFFVYYFQMYLSMVVIGSLHGLIFLPVFLSYFGPPYIPVNCRSPYPLVDDSETRDPSQPVTSEGIDNDERKKLLDEEQHRPASTNNRLYPDINDGYQGYGAPTYGSNATTAPVQ